MENKTFESRGKDIEERAFRFAIRIIKLSSQLPRTTATFVIVRQLIRSATSIGANLVEGSAAISRKEFVNFISISKKSAIETKFWLRLLVGSELISPDKIDSLIQECNEIIKIISTIIIKTKNKK